MEPQKRRGRPLKVARVEKETNPAAEYAKRMLTLDIQNLELKIAVLIRNIKDLTEVRDNSQLQLDGLRSRLVMLEGLYITKDTWEVTNAKENN
jgi:hypothetical protein